MKNVTDNYSDKFKENIELVSEKSKKSIHDIIDSSSRQFETVLDVNNTFIESLEKQVLNKDFKNNSLISEVKKSFSDSAELSEEAIDTIIDIQSKQLKSTIDFNSKLIEAIKNIGTSDNKAVKEVLDLVNKNIEESSNQSIENAKKITAIYNKHLNLALNFNKQFSAGINSQMQMLNEMQNRNIESFNHWVEKWWKNTEETMA